MPECRYLILGGGVAGGYAAKEFAERGAGNGEVLLVSADSTLPYERPPLSKKYMAGLKDDNDILINNENFYRERGMEVRLNTRATDVDLENRRLRADSGEEFRYEKLLLATGARPRKLELRRTDLDGFFYLRSLADASRIRDRADHSNRAVVIGGGYIGMETAATLARKGLSVTLISATETLLPRVFTPEMSAFFESYYTARNVSLQRNTKIKAIRGKHYFEAALLETGRILRADLALAGVGAVPVLELFDGTPLRKTDQAGLEVDETLQTSVPGVYAAGDITHYPDVLFDKRRRVEHWDNAVEQAKCAVHNMLGERENFEKVPYFFSDMFDLSWEFWGDMEGADQVVYRGDVREPSFSAWWLKGGRVVAAFVMNRPDDEREAAQQWIRERRETTQAELQAVELPVSSPSHAG